MKFIIGTKREMTQLFLEDGQVEPVTKIHVGSCFVIKKKTLKTDGYEAVQVGIKADKTKKIVKNAFAKIKEFRLPAGDPVYTKLADGQSFNAGIFTVGDIVDVQGFSKGKGFQGVVRRHGFAGGPASHGHKDNLRMPGSIGATHPNHVFKGTRMGGHMGDEKITVKNLKVIKIDSDNNEIYLRGAVPGAANGYLFIEGKGDFDVTLPVVESEAVVEAVNEPIVETQPVVEKVEEKIVE